MSTWASFGLCNQLIILRKIKRPFPVTQGCEAEAEENGGRTRHKRCCCIQQKAINLCELRFLFHRVGSWFNFRLYKTVVVL